MAIAISTSGTTLDSPMDSRFGRAAGFILVDDAVSAEATARHLDNSKQASASSGAGPATVQALVEQGVTSIITGHVGPKAASALTHAGIAMYGDATGTVREALEAFAAGTLKTLS